MPRRVRRFETFEEIAPEFLKWANETVWCNGATVDQRGRPRSRVLHPIWEGRTGWITTERTSPKGQDLTRNPFISLAYVHDPFHPAFADCQAE
jgi:pyridoxine/pyridoxamine 5'-phosphate oxidase